MYTDNNLKFENAEMALLALSANLIVYSKQGYLVTSFVNTESNSFELSINYTDKEKPEPWQGFHPSKAIWHEHESRCEPGRQIKVLELFFEV